MPGLDGNGLAEIVLASGGTNMGKTWGSLAIVETTPRATAFGHTGTFSGNSGAVEKDCRIEAARILARPGAKPAALAPLTLEEDGTGYEPLPLMNHNATRIHEQC